MPDHIDTRITPSLHPDNVKEVEGYDDDTKPYLAPTETAFSTAYEAIRAIHDTKVIVDKNTGWTDDAKVMRVDAFAREHMDKITRTFDFVRGNLVKQISALEQALVQPVESRAAVSIAAEIRQHVKSMDTGERHSFIRAAIDRGDDITASAVLGAPPYLSGLTPEFQTSYTRLYREQSTPQTAKRLKALVGAKELIETRAGLVFAEIEKAVGAPPDKANKLRERQTAAEKALGLKTAA